ncbi:fibronectin type III domain-containing protein [Tenacibaculum jejuense]|uniref:Fibronectin type-III domain-containing protein n=1 Tax=Tenacibaculum jejuense TaxID=584609 RepID=A0A238UDF3_9FLAO|nr:fibronectin type III domain-containing protein [Tenacibaculum jejuense]SNR17233.1 Protein of unknown function precursor containing a C-terminal secretion signal [Tenacibaculum jejuense]
MKSNLKLLIGGLSVTLVTAIGYKKYTSYKSINEIEEKRQTHTNFLKNSPFKERLQWDKKTRKLNGLPPNKYFEQMWELTINPATGRLEDENVAKLRQELTAQRLARRVPGDNNSPWVERGPNNVGGRTRAILFDPNDATNRRVYAGGVSGGLWVNNDITNANSQWQRVQNVPGNLSVTSITVDPRNSNNWYLGTGEQYTAGDVVGNGVYRSTNGGTTWTAVNIPAAGAATFDFNAGNVFLSGINYVNDIVAWDNGSSTELFVGVGANVYSDASSPTNWLGLQSAGLYRSTDNGNTWNRVENAGMSFEFSGANYYFIPNDLEIGSDNRLWMGTITTPGLGQGGGRVFSSTNGATWTEAAASPLLESNRVELEPSSTNPNRLYALAQGTTSAAPVRIFETTNAFNTVRTLSLPNDADRGIPANDFTRGQAFYDLVIEADPNNDDVVYVGGIDLFRSNNGGGTWTQISQWRNLGLRNASFVHADHHAITFAGNSSTRMLFGNDGGVYYSNNGGGTIAARNRGYNVTQFVKAGIGPDGPGDRGGIFTAGAQDNGTQAFRNATAGINSSTELSDGDGFYTFVDKDGQFMISTFTNNVIYRFNLPWNGRSRIQGGATTLSNSQNTGDFVNPMDYDSDANRLLSNNSTRATSTTPAAFSILSINVAANSRGTLTNDLLNASPTAFRASPFTNNRWFVGLANGRLLRLSGVNNSNATFTQINTPFVGSISSVRFGATENDIFVTMHNYGVVSVWATTDGGANWVSREGNLPNIPVRDILQNPLDRNEAILATQLGVWSTSNFNAAAPNWTQAYNGMSDVSVTAFDYWNVNGNNTENRIIASTYGRGVFTGEFTANTAADTQAPSRPNNVTASNVTSTSLTLSWSASTDNVGVTGYDVYQGSTLIGTTASTSTNITGLTANTAYTFTVRAKDAANNQSNASTAVNVTTPGGASSSCASTVSSFPYSESFEANVGWTQVTGDDGNWLRDSGGTPSNGTGPSNGADGSFYLFLEASNNSSAGQIGSNATAILQSPCFDLSGESSASFSFSNHMFGTSVGSLTLQASTDGTSWVNLWTDSGNQGNQWNDVSVDLAAYLGGTVSLRFVGVTGTSWSSDIAIDNLALTAGGNSGTPTSPACEALDFNNFTVSSFSNQDNAGNFSVSTDGSSITLTNNTWKSIPLDYTVTANTVIEFEFSSTSEGEIHGIGFETDNNLSANNYFKLHGTQNYGVTNFDNYAGGTRTYAITVGASYTGTMNRLVFINDNDGGSGNTSTFTNVRIYEGSCSSAAAVVSAQDFDVRNDLLGDEDEDLLASVKIGPNPVVKGNVLRIISSKELTNTSYTIFNTFGQALKTGRLENSEIATDNLATGVYLLNLSNDYSKITKQIIVK